MKKLSVLLCTIIASCLHAQLTQQSVSSLNAPGGRIYFYQYKPPHYNNTDLFPLIISLHGGGEAGTDDGASLLNVTNYGLPQLVKNGGDGVLEFTWQGKTEGFIMLAPQTNPTLVNNWPVYYVDEMIEYGINNLRVDPNRIFLTGYSLGGKGVWQYAASSTTAASKLAGLIPAAAIPVDAGTNFCNIASSQVAVWVQHALHDEFGNVQQAIDYTNAINACQPLLVPAVDTIYPTGSHGIYMTKTYDFTNGSHYPNLFQWMLKVNRNINTLTDQPPVPVIAAGNTVDLITPVKVQDFPVLDGSGSSDDNIIMDYLWEQTGGPATILSDDINRQWPTMKIVVPDGTVGIDPGLYSFRLRVKDYLTSMPGHTQFATININVQLPASGHSAPATNAGPDHLLASTETYWLSQGAYKFYGSTFSSSPFNWRIIKAPVAAPVTGSLVPGIENFNGGPYPGNDNNVRFVNMETPGDYEFEFSVTNNFSETGRDTIKLTRLSSALPVNYAYFNGKNTGSSNVLTWATTSEINSDHFDIKRSADGTSFSKTGTVNSKGGSLLTEYIYEDVNTPLGISYYRLSQVDKDGHSGLSKTISVNNNGRGVYIEKYPNPVHNDLSITVQTNTNGSLQMVIADMQGKTVIQQQWQMNQSLLKRTIDVSALQNGVYHMIITIGGEKQITGFVKY